MPGSLPDDSRDADEREAARALRDLRARVKRARAVIASTPGLAEVLDSDPRRGAMFYARLGVTIEQAIGGVADPSALSSENREVSRASWQLSANDSL